MRKQVGTKTYIAHLGPKSKKGPIGWLNQIAREERNGVLRSTAELTAGMPGWEDGNDERLTEGNPSGVSNGSPGRFTRVITPENIGKYYGGGLSEVLDTLASNQDSMM